MNHGGALYKQEDCQVMRMQSSKEKIKKKKKRLKYGTDHPIQMADTFESIDHHCPLTYMTRAYHEQTKGAGPFFQNSKIIILEKRSN